MGKLDKNYFILPLLYLIVLSYLIINTGLVSDDFALMARLKDKNFLDILIPKGIFYFIERPVVYFSHYIWYYFFQIDDLTIVNILKILYIFLSFYLISQFFKIFLDRQNAFLISFFFIFFPSHDSIVYSFILHYLILSFAFYFYSFYLAYNNKLAFAFLSALIASFISYGSSVIAIALFFLFTLHKEFKKGLVLLIPNILYSFYYIFLSKVMVVTIDKISMGSRLTGIDSYLIIKQFILQMLTFIDATVGPSMWIKIYYSFFQLSIPSIIIGILLTTIFYKKFKNGNGLYNRKLILSFTVLTFLSFAMFAITGHYPQLAFNLGNRVTIFGSLLLAYLIVLMPLSKKIKTLVFAVLIFTILGNSDHWKSWYLHQQQVIANIKNNQTLKNYHDTRVIYVSGNQYSKYGPISHIEFLSEKWVTQSLFKLVFKNRIQTEPLNKRHVYREGYLMDTKYNTKVKVDNYINIYDSEKDILFKLDIEKINNYIDSLPSDNRHWVQILNNKFINDIVIKLMPRLKYAL